MGSSVVPRARAPFRRWATARWRRATHLLLWLGATACAPGLDAPERFTEEDCAGFDVPRDLFLPRCGSSECHDAFDPAAGMDLVSGGVEERLAGVESTTCVGRRRIDPHDPAASFLLVRVAPDPSCREVDLPRMPRDAPALEAREQTCLAEWVERVAAQHADRVAPLADAGRTPPADAGPADAGPADGGDS